MKYLSNAFSLQMVTDHLENGVNIHAETADMAEVAEAMVDGAKSAIGHTDTAAVVSNMLGQNVPAQRVNISLAKGDILYVAQLTGGRLPEGSTTLPEGFSITFVKVTL